MSRLEAFLYVLMRDELPTGKVCAIINDHAGLRVPGFIPSSEPLADLARDYALRLLKGVDTLP